MADSTDANRLDFDVALWAVADVLLDAQASNLTVQDHLGRFLDRKIDAATLIHELQTLDRTAQILADLAAVCRYIATECQGSGPGGQIDLDSVVKLDMTRRAFRAISAEQSTPETGGEDVHLFG